MTPEYKVALFRGLILGGVAFLGGFCGAILADVELVKAFATGGAAAVPVFMARFGGEGGYDTARSAGVGGQEDRRE